MAAVRTNKILPKLERLIDLRISDGAKDEYKIIVGNRSPATDGTEIYLPRKEGHLKNERDNELLLADSTAHEADHIREFNEYFGTEANRLREEGENLYGEYLQINYSELTENPALAGWIDNVVKDRRIDQERRDNLPGVDRFFKEVLDPGTSYFRPSVRFMNKFDKFREQYLQKALIGKTIEPVPKEYNKLLNEVVKLTNKADSIERDPEIVKQIYQKLKENFDITQKISRLPPRFGRNNHNAGSGDSQQSQTPQYQKGNQDNKDKQDNDKKGKGLEGKVDDKDKNKGKNGKGEGKTDFNKGYEGKVKEREGRNPYDKKPKCLGDDKDKEDKGTSLRSRGGKKKDDKEFYEKKSEEYSINIQSNDSELKISNFEESKKYEETHFRQIDSMKQIFKKLRLEDYADKKDFEGLYLDYEDYMQSDLESEVTGIKGDGKYFNADEIGRQNPAFGIHADISGSTVGDIIEGIRSAFYIIGNALSESKFNYGMYASDDNLYVLKPITKKWNEKVNGKIGALRAGGGGIYLEKTSRVIADDLKRMESSPRILIHISDFEVCGDQDGEKAIAKELYDNKIFPFLITIGKEHEKNAKMLTKEIGKEHYSVIPTNELNRLPNELFRLFKTYGIAK